MEGGAFLEIYNNPSQYGYSWSYRRLVEEQTDPKLQGVHKDAYLQWNRIVRRTEIAKKGANTISQTVGDITGSISGAVSGLFRDKSSQTQKAKPKPKPSEIKPVQTTAQHQRSQN